MCHAMVMTIIISSFGATMQNKFGGALIIGLLFNTTDNTIQKCQRYSLCDSAGLAG
jgi:hypothetical protein